MPGRPEVHRRYTAGTSGPAAGLGEVHRRYTPGRSRMAGWGFVPSASLTWSLLMDDYSASPEPFDAADTAFRLLCAGPQPLALHASKVAAGLPDRPVPVDELRVLLLHPSTSARARNQVWAELVRRARA